MVDVFICFVWFGLLSIFTTTTTATIAATSVTAICGAFNAIFHHWCRCSFVFGNIVNEQCACCLLLAHSLQTMLTNNHIFDVHHTSYGSAFLLILFAQRKYIFFFDLLNSISFSLLVVTFHLFSAAFFENKNELSNIILCKMEASHLQSI